MEDSSVFTKLVSHLRSVSRYYTGYPRDIGPSKVIEFKSERQFVQLLHEGYPIVVAFTIRCAYAKHLDRMLDAAAAEFHPSIKFMRVECPSYPGFCLARQRKDYPFIEIFHSPIQADKQGKIIDATPVTRYTVKVVPADKQGKIIDATPVTRYTVKVVPFNYDVSPYGFREFFKRQGISTMSQTPAQDIQ